MRGYEFHPRPVVIRINLNNRTETVFACFMISPGSFPTMGDARTTVRNEIGYILVRNPSGIRWH